MNSDGLCNTDTLDAFVQAGHEWAPAKLVFKEWRKECEVYFGLSNRAAKREYGRKNGMSLYGCV